MTRGRLMRNVPLLGCVAPEPSPEFVTIAEVLGVPKGSTPHPPFGKTTYRSNHILGKGYSCSVPEEEDSSEHQDSGVVQATSDGQASLSDADMPEQRCHRRESGSLAHTSALENRWTSQKSPQLQYQFPNSTPAPDAVRLTPASMQTGVINYEKLAEQPHSNTPASDVTSQPVQPMHSFASGDTSTCTVSAAVRVPTSPDEDKFNTAESPAKAVPGVRCCDEEQVAALPLQTIMENSLETGTVNTTIKGRRSSPSGKRQFTPVNMTPASSWDECSPAHTVGETAAAAASGMRMAQPPETVRRQTPCLKRSRSVVADVGGNNAFCVSTGYTVRQPVGTGVSVDVYGDAALVGSNACGSMHQDGIPVPPSIASSYRQSTSIRLCQETGPFAGMHGGDSTVFMSSDCLGSACGLQPEITLATPLCHGLHVQEHCANPPGATETQNAVNLASSYVIEGEESVHNPAASQASGTNWGAHRQHDAMDSSSQHMRRSGDASQRHKQSGLDKSLLAPLQLDCGQENVLAVHPTSTELVAWSPHKQTSHPHPQRAERMGTSVLVPVSHRGSVSPCHLRACQLPPSADDRINKVDLASIREATSLSVAVQCAMNSPGAGKALVHRKDLEDAVNSAMQRRQLQVVQQFVAESVVPTLAQCALTPAEHSLGPLATQAMGMLDDAARAGVEPCIGFLQAAVARLQDTAARTHELNAQLSATRAEVRAAEFELKVVRAEKEAALREFRACERENECLRKEAESEKAQSLARNSTLEDELAEASSAREVLALALARLLRDTKAQNLHVHHAITNPVDALEAQLNGLSVHNSTASAPSRCNDVIASSLAAARKILETGPDVAFALPSTSPVFMETRGQGRQAADGSECLESRVLRFASSHDQSCSPQPGASAEWPGQRVGPNIAIVPARSAERRHMTPSTDGVRQGSPACEAPVSAPRSQAQAGTISRTASPMSNPMRTPSSMGESVTGVGNALPGLSPIHALPVSAASSPVDDGGVPPTVGGHAEALQLAMVPTRARTPDCFLDRMHASRDKSYDASILDVAARGVPVAAQCHQVSHVSHVYNPAGAHTTAAQAVPQRAQHTNVLQQREEPQPSCALQLPDMQLEEHNGLQPDLKRAESGKGRLHIPADVCGSRDESDHDSLRAWQRSLGMSYVADSHAAPFSVLLQRRSASHEAPRQGGVGASQHSQADKDLIALDATAPGPWPAVDESSRPAPTLASQHSLIDADMPLSASRGPPTTNHRACEAAQLDGPTASTAAVKFAAQHAPAPDSNACTAIGASHHSRAAPDHTELVGHSLQLASPPHPSPRPAVYPDVAASPEFDHPASGTLPSASAQEAALEVRRFCAMAGQQCDPEDRPRGAKGKPHVTQCVVPTSPDLQTARRAQRTVEGKMTASQERARASMGRKRATVLAGHFGGSYAAKAKALAQAKGNTGTGYAVLAARARKRRA